MTRIACTAQVRLGLEALRAEESAATLARPDGGLPEVLRADRMGFRSNGLRLHGLVMSDVSARARSACWNEWGASGEELRERTLAG